MRCDEGRGEPVDDSGAEARRHEFTSDHIQGRRRSWNGGAQFVQLEKLPAYAPDLNPDEGVWQHLKHIEMRNMCCTDLPHLSVELNLAVKRLPKKPSVIQSFFAGAGLDI